MVGKKELNIVEKMILVSEKHLASKGYQNIENTRSINELVAIEPDSNIIVFFSVRGGTSTFPEAWMHPSFEDREEHVIRWLSEHNIDPTKVVVRLDDIDIRIVDKSSVELRIHKNSHYAEAVGRSQLTE